MFGQCLYLYNNLIFCGVFLENKFSRPLVRNNFRAKRGYFPPGQLPTGAGFPALGQTRVPAVPHLVHIYSIPSPLALACRRLPIIPQFLGPPRASLILACVEEYSWGLCLDRNICGNSARAVKVLLQALQLICLNVQSSKRKLNSLALFLATILPFAM